MKNQIDKTHLIILQSKLREYKDIQVEIVSIFVFREREREKKLQHSAFNLKCGVKLRSNVHLTPPILPVWSVECRWQSDWEWSWVAWGHCKDIYQWSQVSLVFTQLANIKHESICYKNMLHSKHDLPVFYSRKLFKYFSITFLWSYTFDIHREIHNSLSFFPMGRGLQRRNDISNQVTFVV